MVDGMPVKLVRTIDRSNSIYYEESFRRVIEDHLPILLTDGNYSVVTLDPTTTEPFSGDFYGLLKSNSSPHYMHWIILRMNGYSSPVEYRSETISIKVPLPRVLDKIVRQYLSSQNI